MPTELPRFDGGWAGPDIANGSDAWMIHLSDAEIDEIDRTVRALESKEIVEIGREDAPLPILEPKIAAMREDLLNGRGFAQIRGFLIERYSLAEAARAFWAIGTHLGAAVSQNAKGHALGHVRDLGFDYAVASARGYQTNARLPYHTDSGDVVGLLSVKTSRTGGMSSLVSSVALYNAMAERRPDLALVLMEPTFRDRRDEIPAHRRPWYPMPVFNPHKGRMLTHYVRSAIRKAQRFDLVPRTTPAQEEAFDYLDALAEGPEFHLDIEFRPGDMQFCCNHTILHSRTAYEDWPEPERRRHLLRLWLACPGGPDLPAFYEEQQGFDAAGRPMGIACPGAALNADLEATDGGAGASDVRQKRSA